MTQNIETFQFICSMVIKVNISGVVGRERMGTTFPHMKLSRNGVHTREILTDIFSLAILYCHHVTIHSVHLKPYQNWTSESKY